MNNYYEDCLLGEHFSECYCNDDQGCGYSYSDEHGDCAFCKRDFEVGQTICPTSKNELRVCPNHHDHDDDCRRGLGN